jgi:regulator of replication initiation timing
METGITSVVETFGLIAVGMISLSFAIKKLLKDWGNSNTEQNIINLLKEEISRMSEQNKTLSLELGRLQKEIIDLHDLVTNLSSENGSLRIEISALTNELTAFKKLALLKKVKVTSNATSQN